MKVNYYKDGTVTIRMTPDELVTIRYAIDVGAGKLRQTAIYLYSMWLPDHKSAERTAKAAESAVRDLEAAVADSIK